MRIVILTSSRRSTASYCMPLLINQTNAEIVQVILNQGQSIKNKKYYAKRLKKIWKIGLAGAINGVRIRTWFEGMKMKKSLKDIEEICKEAGINYAETPAINHAKTVELMREARADLGISLSNSYIPKKVFSLPHYGMINIHGEILPDFQNAQSIIWQIYENHTETGYTIHRIDHKIDTGDILKQERYPLQFKNNLEDTVRFMVEETLIRSGKGLVDVINHFEKYLQEAKGQGEGRTYTTPSIWQFIQIKRNFNQLKKASVIRAEE